MDVIRQRGRRSARTLVVAVMHNPEKHGFLPVPMRVELLKTACRGLNNVRVIAHGGLLIDCAHEVGAKAVIRGLRPLGDFESEYQMAQVNKRLGGVETLLMTTSDDCAQHILKHRSAGGGLRRGHFADGAGGHGAADSWRRSPKNKAEITRCLEHRIWKMNADIADGIRT